MSTALIPTPAPSSAPVGPAAGPGVGCPACPHLVADHDPIGARFCRATVEGVIDRGCVCEGR